MWSNCDIIKLDINDKKITTTKQTLLKYPNSTLFQFINNILSNNKDPNKEIKIERDTKSFMNLISYLRNDKMPIFKEDKEYQNFLDEYLSSMRNGVQKL